MDYKTAGVDIECGDQFVRSIKELIGSICPTRHGSQIGGFAGAFPLHYRGDSHRHLVACTDGVGTKLKIVFEMGRHDTIGIDLVAMSVNDLLVTGATPMFFLDYLATGKLVPKIHLEVIKGIIKGCAVAECELLGGETAEMPEMYNPGEYDLAGFAVGIVDDISKLNPENTSEQDVLIGIPSVGIHSNGYSLVRKVFQDRHRFPLDKPLDGMSEPLGDVLLEPTRIYIDEIRTLLQTGGIKSIAHITGGGITGNLPRIINPELGAVLDPETWTHPKIFSAIQTESRMNDIQMYQTFNMGLGLIAVCDPNRVEDQLKNLHRKSISAGVVGCLTKGNGVEYRKGFMSSQLVENRSISFAVEPKPLRIAVIGSGRGSNMESICSAIDRGDLRATVVCVISNNSNAVILNRARKRDIPVFHISHSKFDSQDLLDQEMLNIFNKFNVDLVCLAGYMKKLSPTIISEYQNRILNIHPALLPAFGGKGMYGANVHEAVIGSGARFSGASVHLVTEQYDEGRILAQDIVPVYPADTKDELAERVLQVEHKLYWRAIRQWQVDYLTI